MVYDNIRAGDFDTLRAKLLQLTEQLAKLEARVAALEHK